MTQGETLRRIRNVYMRSIEHMLKAAYQTGYEAGLARARGQGRRGRTVRGDATVAGLVKLIERHFGLDRYGFEVRIVHASGRRVPSADQLRKHLLPDQ